MLTELHQRSPNDRPSSVIPSSVLAFPRPPRPQFHCSANRSVGSNVLAYRRGVTVVMYFVGPAPRSSTHRRAIQSVHAVRKVFVRRDATSALPLRTRSHVTCGGWIDKKGSTLHIFSYSTRTAVNRLVQREKLRKNLHANSTILSSPNF